MDVEEVVREGGSPKDPAWGPVSHCSALLLGGLYILLSWLLVGKLHTGFYPCSVKEQER